MKRLKRKLWNCGYSVVDYSENEVIKDFDLLIDGNKKMRVGKELPDKFVGFDYFAKISKTKVEFFNRKKEGSTWPSKIFGRAKKKLKK